MATTTKSFVKVSNNEFFQHLKQPMIGTKDIENLNTELAKFPEFVSDQEIEQIRSKISIQEIQKPISNEDVAKLYNEIRILEKKYTQLVKENEILTQENKTLYSEQNKYRDGLALIYKAFHDTYPTVKQIYFENARISC